MPYQRITTHWIRLFLLFVQMSALAASLEIVLEAESGQLEGQHGGIISRRSASSGRTVSLRQGGAVSFDICIPHTMTLKLNKLSYSNDGYSDIFSVAVGNRTIFRSESNAVFWGGKGWNKFKTVLIGVSFSVDSGKDKLIIKVEDADYFGLEVDSIEMSVESDIGLEEFLCRSRCIADIDYKSRMENVDFDPDSYIVQSSSETKCAEEDNINIPLFAKNADSITITAEPPKYHSPNNNRAPDFTNCDMVSAFWLFEDIVFESDETVGDRFHMASVGPKHTKHIHGNVAALISGINTQKMTVKILFNLEGRSKGVVDADIGSILLLRFKDISEMTVVNVHYIGKNNVTSGNIQRVFDPMTLEQTWDIPDYTWTDEGENVILIHIESVLKRAVKRVDIERVELFRRHKRPTRFFHMFNDGRYLMEGADIDFWWLINQTMSVQILDNGDFFPKTDYFRVYARIPWLKDHFTQIFVLYQDGNVRLLPITPPGFDWVPFGSSILIGPANPSVERPSAPIRHVDISMETLYLHIYYADGTTLALSIAPSTKRTVLKIEDIRLNSNSVNLPLVTFRSMWVSNGNSDVDHVISNGNVMVPILSNWDRLYGSSFAFFRKCISRHNTQSPDIIIDIHL